MNKKLYYTLLTTGLLAAAGMQYFNHQLKEGGIEAIPDVVVEHLYQMEPSPVEGFAGNFLASHFAQSQYDWRTANKYLDEVLDYDPDDFDLLKRSMILAMGSGELKQAALRAETIIEQDPANSLAGLILVIDKIARGNTEEMIVALDTMPAGDVTDFIKPVLRGWVSVSAGEFQVENLNITTVHSYSAALMALTVGNIEEAENYARRMLEIGSISTFDAERAGDLYVLLGKEQEALALYQGAALQDDHSENLSKKIKELSAEVPNAAELEKLIEAARIKTVSQGAALAMHDMARILYQEQSDSSAKLFAQMALALDPDFMPSQLLLANTLARNGRFEEAIEYFSAVKPEQDNYIIVQRHIAELMEEAGDKEGALVLLNKLFADHNDVESLIRIGDLHRGRENYNDALQAYNRAAKQVGEDVPEEFWYLLYARGMAYEREGQWADAERDLKAALGYRPDHPYLMNYLGYGWADQGVNLEESLELIERASMLRPTDGYIKDSLGWVLFMMARYEDAIPHLERAVELLPYDETLNDHLGDAYWQVGRHLEARFQWRRALNGSEDPELRKTLQSKITDGLVEVTVIKEARSQAVPQ